MTTVFPCAAKNIKTVRKSHDFSPLAEYYQQDNATCCDGTGLGSGPVVVGFRVQKTTIRVPSRTVDVSATCSTASNGCGFTVTAATTAALPTYTVAGSPTTLTATANGAFPVTDGVTLSLANTILVKDEATAKYNGVYSLTQVGDAGSPWILTRHAIMDSDVDLASGMVITVGNGTVNRLSVCGCRFRLTTPDPITLDTTDLTFASISQAGLIVEKTIYRIPASMIVSTTCEDNTIGCLPSFLDQSVVFGSSTDPPTICAAAPRYWRLTGPIDALGNPVDELLIGESDIANFIALAYLPPSCPTADSFIAYLSARTGGLCWLLYGNFGFVALSTSPFPFSGGGIARASFNCYGSNTFSLSGGPFNGQTATIEPYEP